MEFFIPGLLLFLVSILVSFLFAPKATPLIMAILSIAFLTYGVYDHYKMFAAEYRLSTWQQSLKIYAPAIMIASIIIFIIYGILAFFTKGAVPVPPMPSLAAPNENTTTNQVVQSFNKVANSLANAKNDLVNSINKSINNAGSLLSNENGTNKRNGNNLSRSFLETI
jgi:uncharacterized membrane protein